MPQHIAHQRQISHLFHFTRFANLQGILQNGLIPRQVLIAQQMPFLFNDLYRHDGRTNANCLSITFPNYKMFYPTRLDHPNDDWAVLRLSPRILWEKNCLFCEGNAARYDIAATAENLLQGRVALEHLFAEKNWLPPREHLRLLCNEPTDVQAEVLVFGVIEPQYIIDININRQGQTRDFNHILNFARQHRNFTWRHEPDYYYPRHDHRARSEFENG